MGFDDWKLEFHHSDLKLNVSFFSSISDKNIKNEYPTVSHYFFMDLCLNYGTYHFFQLTLNPF